MSYLEYVTVGGEFTDPVEELSHANHFTLDDLQRNREGWISPTQKTNLFSRALRPVQYPLMATLGCLMAYFVVTTLVPGIILALAAVLGGKSITAAFAVIIFLCLGSLAVALLKSGRRIVLLLQDLSSGRAECLEGRGNTSREEDKGLGLDSFHGLKRQHYWYVMNGEYFEVDENAAGVLTSGGRYRLYHTPKSKLLLSIEPAGSTRL